MAMVQKYSTENTLWTRWHFFNWPARKYDYVLWNNKPV